MGTEMGCVSGGVHCKALVHRSRVDKLVAFFSALLLLFFADL